MKKKTNWFKKSFAKFKREWREVGACLEKNRRVDGFLSLCFNLAFLLGLVIGVALGYIYCNYKLVPIA